MVYDSIKCKKVQVIDDIKRTRPVYPGREEYQMVINYRQVSNAGR
jgi:hypothetical protein